MPITRSVLSRLLGVALIPAALAGSYLSLPLAFGVDFRFASVATLLALRVYGVMYGAFVALLVAVYSVALGSPLGAGLISLAEALFVGLFLGRGRTNLLLLDSMYWLFLGMPLVGLIFADTLQMDRTAIAVAMFEEGVNGILNALLASLAAHHLFLRLGAPTRDPRDTMPLYDTLFNLLVAAVLLPGLALMSLNGRQEIERIEADIRSRFDAAGRDIPRHLVQWHQKCLNAVASLAQFASGRALEPSEALQHDAKVLKRAFSEFHNLGVVDLSGRSVAFYPAVDGQGQSMIGRSMLGPQALQELGSQTAPATSDVFLGPAWELAPVITLSAPVLGSSGVQGYAVGALDLAQLGEMLRHWAHSAGLEMTLLDRHGRIISSTRPERPSMSQLDARASSQMRTLGAPKPHWQHGMHNASAMARWMRSSYVQETKVADELPWRLLVEAPVAPQQQYLYSLFAKNLAILLSLAAVALVLALVIARSIVRPLERLAEVTTGLPARLLDRDAMAWPMSRTTEVQSLVNNFQIMVAALRTSFRQLQARTAELTRINEELRAQMAERRRLEDQMRQSQKMEAIGTLAGGIAHDFNNILAAILGYTELALLEVPEEGRAARRLREVVAAVKRARDLVQQILTFSRRRPQERVAIELHPAIKEALRLLRASLPSSIAIEQHIDEAAGTVLADATQVHQVLMNLCVNAEHAMRSQGGLLEVRLEGVALSSDQAAATHPELRPGRWVRLTVRDTGHGMPPEVVDRIFEPFYTTKAAGEGTGLGLSVVHGIIAGHSGAITVNSTPGRGTSFEIYLPCIDATPQTGGAATPQLMRGTECILFVDDEVALADLGRQALESLGYEVVAYTASPQALEAFRAEPQRFDLVISDQTMPFMTGDRLIEELRRIRPDVPVLLCTGFGHTVTIERIQSLGIERLLYKPLQIHEVATAVRNVLDARKKASDAGAAKRAGTELARLG